MPSLRAGTFGVSVASVVKWSQRFRATGSAKTKSMGGKRPYALEAEREWLLRRIAKLKTLLRKAAARTVEAARKRIGELLDDFEPAECANDLRNAGYASI